MIEVGLVDFEQHALGGWIDLGAVVFQDLELGEAGGVVETRRRALAQRRAVKAVQLAVLLEAPVQREAEQAALVEIQRQWRQLAAHVEEKFVEQLAVLREDAHRAELIDDEQATRIVVQGDHGEGGREALGNELETEAGLRIGGEGGRVQLE